MWDINCAGLNYYDFDGNIHSIVILPYLFFLVKPWQEEQLLKTKNLASEGMAPLFFVRYSLNNQRLSYQLTLLTLQFKIYLIKFSC